MNLKFLFGTLAVALVMVGCRQSAETPESAARHVELGLQKFALGQYQESSEAYSKAIQLDPGNDSYFNFRGVAHRKLGEWEAARADFTQAIARNSKESRYFLNRAETHELLGNPVDAILDYKKAEELGATEASKALKHLRAKAPSVHLEIEQISEQPDQSSKYTKPVSTTISSTCRSMKNATTNFISTLKNSDLFFNVGAKLQSERHTPVNSWDDAIRLCLGEVWEYMILESRNLLTNSLSDGWLDRYQAWNDIVREIKHELILVVDEKCSRCILPSGSHKALVDQVRWDFLSYCMELEYEDCVEKGFYSELIEIYMMGHFPCGWDGMAPTWNGTVPINGKLFVF